MRNPTIETDAGAAADAVLNALFLLGLLGAVIVVLTLPVFPTGDGPVHLYYAEVLWSLLRHQSIYAHDYAIRHLFAPYLVHYLALILLEHFVSPAMAEKLFVVLILTTTGLGFRFLARRLGAQAALASVWMLPLLFSWSLGGGFMNCCFATGVVLWGFGLWVLLGRAGARAGWLLAAFAVMLGVLVLSHPVPLMVLLLFSGSDLLLLAVARRLTRRGTEAAAAAPFVPQAVAFVLTCVAFIAPVMMAQKGQAAAVLPASGFHLEVLQELLSGACLGYFSGISLHSASGLVALVSRVGLVLMVPGVALLFLRRVNRGHRDLWEDLVRSPAARLLLLTMVFLFATIFFPRALNHSFYFPERMWDICWLLVLACGAGARLGTRAQRSLGAGGLALVICTVASGFPALFRIARAQAQLAAAPLPAGKRGLLLEPYSAFNTYHGATSYPVFFWSGARAFAASHTVLLNSPWLTLTILPVRDADAPMAGQALLNRGLPSWISESPLAVTALLARGTSDPRVRKELTAQLPHNEWGRDRREILARADFLLYVNPASLGSAAAAEETRDDALALLAGDSPAWSCEARGFYALCTRRT